MLLIPQRVKNLLKFLKNYASYENAQTQVIIIEKESEEEPMEESGEVV